MLKPNQPLALYMEGAVDQPFGKMGYGLLRYSQNPIACVVDSHTAGGDISELTGIKRACPIVGTVEEAKRLGAEVFVLGIAPPGGALPDEWFLVIDTAVGLGLSVVNGLHDRLGRRYPALTEGQWVWDVRAEPSGLAIGTGAAATLRNKRVLMIGTDMSVGKMSAGLELLKSAREQGIRAEFVATGQIGIVIMGKGVPLDAIRLDFASGAIEREVIAAKDAELIIIEGQGALIHPASTANLPLLRGSCPNHLILCHRAGQVALSRQPHIKIPPLNQYIELYRDLAEACGTFPRPIAAAIALNTGHIESENEARDACSVIAEQTGLPCADVVRFGGKALLESLD